MPRKSKQQQVTSAELAEWLWEAHFDNSEAGIPPWIDPADVAEKDENIRLVCGGFTCPASIEVNGTFVDIPTKEALLQELVDVGIIVDVGNTCFVIDLRGGLKDTKKAIGQYHKMFATELNELETELGILAAEGMSSIE